MSVSAVIASIDGRLARSKDSSAAASVRGCAAAPSAPAETVSSESGGKLPETSVLCLRSESRFNRAQRKMKLPGSVIPRSPILLCHARRLLITLTLDEGTLDMMLGDELHDGVYDLRRHWHCFDKIAAGIGESLSLGRISRYGKNLIWPLPGNRTQGNP
jgi:hypothetical protein